MFTEDALTTITTAGDATLKTLLRALETTAPSNSTECATFSAIRIAILDVLRARASASRRQFFA